jgi:hypothetical protein
VATTVAANPQEPLPIRSRTSEACRAPRTRDSRPGAGLLAAGTAAAIAAVLATGCAPGGAEPAPFPEPAALASPAGPGAGEPHLHAGVDGTLLLSWQEPGDEGGHRLRFATLRDGGWSEPGTIAAGTGWFVNWADFPSIVRLPDGSLAAHWLVRSGPGTYAYDVLVARSFDGGATWSEPVTPHRDGTQTEHGFVSLFPWSGEALGAVWLDGRNFAGHGQGHGHGDEGDAGPDMTLRFAALSAGGGLDAEEVLDGRVCDCCQTGVALTEAGPLIVYRGRSAGEVRDILRVRHVAGRWSAPAPVHDDGWEIAACPVNGPAVAAAGSTVAVAWFTAARDTSRVRVAFSRDAGETFQPPVTVDDGAPIGRVAVVLLPDGAVAVSWLEATPGGAELRVRRVAGDGGRGPARVVSPATAARAGGFPRMALSGDRLVLAWTEPGEPRQLRLATLGLE